MKSDEGNQKKLSFDNLVNLSLIHIFARVVVAVFASRLNPTLEEIDDIKTAVSEAVTNAVIHGYGNEDGVIYIETAAEGQELCVTIRDLSLIHI